MMTHKKGLDQNYYTLSLATAVGLTTELSASVSSNAYYNFGYTRLNIETSNGSII